MFISICFNGTLRRKFLTGFKKSIPAFLHTTSSPWHFSLLLLVSQVKSAFLFCAIRVWKVAAITSVVSVLKDRHVKNPWVTPPFSPESLLVTERSRFWKAQNECITPKRLQQRTGSLGLLVSILPISVNSFCLQTTHLNSFLFKRAHL